VDQQNVGAQDTLLHRILVAATSVNAKPNELTHATRLIHRRAKVCTDAEGGYFEHLL
jgi:hypothetical protein